MRRQYEVPKCLIGYYYNKIVFIGAQALACIFRGKFNFKPEPNLTGQTLKSFLALTRRHFYKLLPLIVQYSYEKIITLSYLVRIIQFPHLFNRLTFLLEVGSANTPNRIRFSQGKIHFRGMSPLALLAYLTNEGFILFKNSKF